MKIVEIINSNIIWGLPMVLFMLGTGVYLTFTTRGFIFRKFNIVTKYTIKTLFKRKSSKSNEITPFQAVCTALAGTVGTGNIVGVALAISTGGPGAIFWLWVSALLGMVIKYCEVMLSVAYRTTNPKGEFIGGPMYYISQGMKNTPLAFLFAFFGFLASLGSGASVQANSMTTSLSSTFGLPPYLIGITTAVLSGLILIGGIGRIAKVTEILVPFMAIFYMIGSIFVIIINSHALPSAFLSIFKDAFTGTSAKGGFLGASAMYACRIGIARGVFTHEAGMGSAPIAHASASTDHPARQGLWGAFEVFFDSIVMCTITALVILTSGLWQSGSSLTKGTMCSDAFEQAFSGGRYVVTIGLTLFAFATIIAWYYYGEKCVEYIFGGKCFNMNLYKILYVFMVYRGSITSLNTVWKVADFCNGLMAVPNLTALIFLSPVIKKISDDFFKNPHIIRKNYKSGSAPGEGFRKK